MEIKPDRPAEDDGLHPTTLLVARILKAAVDEGASSISFTPGAHWESDSWLANY